MRVTVRARVSKVHIWVRVRVRVRLSYLLSKIVEHTCDVSGRRPDMKLRVKVGLGLGLGGAHLG